MKVLITGADGQLGNELRHSLISDDLEIVFTNRFHLDISVYSELEGYLNSLKPDFVVNCAAFTNLDKAEDPESRNYPVNHLGVHNLAEISRDLNIGLIHISTDAVFSSSQMREFSKHDKRCPINEYGRAKASAEEELSKKEFQYWILRTSWLFGQYGGNFFQKILESAIASKGVEVVEEQYGQPTWTQDLVSVIQLILSGVIPPGIYHAIGDVQRSRVDFAREIFQSVGTQTELVHSSILGSSHGLAPRPKFSILEKDKELEKFGWVPTPHGAVLATVIKQLMKE